MEAPILFKGAVAQMLELGIKSAFGSLKKAVMHRPGIELGVLTVPYHWGFNSKPNREEARKEFDTIVEVLKSEGVDIYLIKTHATSTPSLYMTRDLGFIGANGLVLSSFRVRYRRGEELYLDVCSEDLGVPVFGKIRDGYFEGGDLVRITNESALVGLGRTDENGAEALREYVEIEPIPVRHTYQLGPHLDTFISMVSKDTALVYESKLPEEIFHILKVNGISRINIAHGDEGTFAANSLRIKDNKVVINEDAKATIKNLQKNGVDTIPVKMYELSKGQCGPRALVLPLLRK